MRLPNAVRHWNKRFLNRLTIQLARASWGPFSIVHHVGRRSGRSYQTPIFAFPTAGGFAIALTYGSGVDWFQNVAAAGGCRILWHRREYSIDSIGRLDRQSALPLFPPFIRMGLRLLGTSDFVQMGFRPGEPC